MSDTLQAQRELARRVATFAARISDSLPTTATSDETVRVERALREALHCLSVAVVASRIKRIGGTDAT